MKKTFFKAIKNKPYVYFLNLAFAQNFIEKLVHIPEQIN